MSRVLVVTADVLRPQIAGPAMRALHISRRLAEDGNDVRLLTTSPYCEVSPQGVHRYGCGPRSARLRPRRGARSWSSRAT